jgi:hypothetical protein
MKDVHLFTERQNRESGLADDFFFFPPLSVLCHWQINSMENRKNSDKRSDIIISDPVCSVSLEYFHPLHLFSYKNDGYS